MAQQGGFKGWSQADGIQNRYYLINDMIAPTYSDLRQTMYLYHTGLDGMSLDLKASKEKIKGSIDELVAKLVKREGDVVWDIFQKDFLYRGEERRTSFLLFSWIQRGRRLPPDFPTTRPSS